MTDSEVTRPRSPWLAVLLSLMMAGLGHVYSGRIARGVMIILVSAIFRILVSRLRVHETLKLSEG